MLTRDASIPLPPFMRRELQLYPGPPGEDGSLSWTLHDPVRQRFFRLGWVESVILSQWGTGSREAIITAARQLAGPVVTEARVAEMERFLVINELVQCLDQGDVKKLILRDQTRQTSWLTWLFHHYLFIKIPLFHPDRFLQALLPFFRLLLSRFFLTIIMLVGLLGIYLTLRQWDLFVHALPISPTPQGAMMLALAVTLAKGVHELGHALAASHFGCRVSSLGLAVIVLWPVLYADTSDTWKLPSRRARLMITGAGVGAELGLAMLATFGWHFFDPGPFRDGLVLLASVTWISTLVINLNPFMRFDGYYLLADALSMPNLGPRVFAMAQWQLRELLFGVGLPPPEQWSTGKRRFLLGYAYATWSYRLVVYLGIALLVYQTLFKLAGILLMMAEVGWFVAWPVVRFFDQTPFARLDKQRLLWLALTLFGVVWLMLFPWRWHVEVPALLMAENHLQMFAPVPAHVTEVFVRAGESVVAGTRLLTLESPDLEHNLLEAGARIHMLEQEAKQMAARPVVLAMRLTLERRLIEARSEEQGLKTRMAMLTITAPFASTVSHVQQGLVAGRWVTRTTVLMELMTPERALVAAWVPEAEIKRLTLGVPAIFLPIHGVGDDLPVVLTSMDQAAVDRLTPPHLASIHGGPIPVRQDKTGAVIPADGWYRITLTPTPGHAKVMTTLPGKVHIPVHQDTLLQQLWIAVAGVWIREMGF